MPAETNRAALAYIAETTWGETPATPELTQIRLTGEELKHQKDTILSAEVRADRMRSDLAEVGASATGPLNFEFSYDTYEPFLESALYSTITTLSIAAVTLAITEADETLTGVAADFDDLLVGSWVKVAGAATPANNGIKQVVSKAVDGSTATFAAGSFTVDEASPSLTITGRDLRNGTTRKSFTFERKVLSGLTEYFQQFRGMIVNDFNIGFVSKQIVTGTFSFLGSVGTASPSTIDNDGTYGATTTTPVMNGTSNVGTLTRDGATMSERVKSFNLTSKNNLRGNDALGFQGNFDVGAGSFEVEGTFEMYFLNNTIYQAFIDHDYTSFSLSVTDGDGNTMIVTVPKMNFSDANPPITGIDADVMQSIPFSGILDPASGASLIINFIDA